MTGRSKGDVSAWLEAASKGERFAHGMLAVPPRLFAAEAKRARKAAKRRRDAERTEAGKRVAQLVLISRCHTRDVKAFLGKLRSWRKQWPLGAQP